MNTEVQAPQAEQSEVRPASYFDGTTFALIGYRLLSFLVTLITLGIAYPWMLCAVQRWETRHTVINGRRLTFKGMGIQLFGRYILWLFLSLITLGIYSIWLGLGIKKWTVKHTFYADEETPVESYFSGGVFGYLGINVLHFVICVFSLFIAAPWASCMVMRWNAKHTHIGGNHLAFNGRGGQLWVKYLVFFLLFPITIGIYALFFPVALLKWQTKHTEAVETPEGYNPNSSVNVLLVIVCILAVIAIIAIMAKGVAAALLKPKTLSEQVPALPAVITSSSPSSDPQSSSEASSASVPATQPAPEAYADTQASHSEPEPIPSLFGSWSYDKLIADGYNPGGGELWDKCITENYTFEGDGRSGVCTHSFGEYYEDEYGEHPFHEQLYDGRYWVCCGGGSQKFDYSFDGKTLTLSTEGTAQYSAATHYYQLAFDGDTVIFTYPEGPSKTFKKD